MAEEELEQVWDAVDAALDLASRTGEVLFDAREALKTLRAPVDPPKRVSEQGSVSRTPIADALYEAYMSGFNDADWGQDAIDEDAFTEAGVALSRMYAQPVERVSEPLPAAPSKT